MSIIILLGKFLDIGLYKSDIEVYLTNWSEWSNCSPYCKQSRTRICTSEFKCFDSDGNVCQGKNCELETKSCDLPGNEKCFTELSDNRLFADPHYNEKLCFNEYL